MSQQCFKTAITDLVIKKAGEEDIPVVLEFIKELASYENLGHEVLATEESMKESLCRRECIECYMAVYQGVPAGFAVIFYNFSTFTGKPGLYLEDLFVRPEYRKKGIGRAMFRFLAGHAQSKNCGRFEWTCLKWNEPSRNFYESMGAAPMDDWMLYRLSEDNLRRLAGQEEII